MREMAETHKTVLVVGGDGEKCRNVAEGYGFKDVVTPGDIMKWQAAVTPFRVLTDDEYKNSRDRDFSQINIDAIFVFADSRHWGDDTQIIMDLLLSKNGRMGTLSETFDEGPPIYFSHNDVVWATSFELNRLGMGALRVFIEALYKERTGKSLQTATSFGKPQIGTFQYATRVLEQWRKDVFGVEGPPKTVYFVGDTPESGPFPSLAIAKYDANRRT
jgi:HAD superfamily hydrolase (TIGR01456 family)